MVLKYATVWEVLYCIYRDLEPVASKSLSRREIRENCYALVRAGYLRRDENGVLRVTEAGQKACQAIAWTL